MNQVQKNKSRSLTLEDRADSNKEEFAENLYEPPKILSREPLEAVAADCSAIPVGKSTAVCTVAFS